MASCLHLKPAVSAWLEFGKPTAEASLPGTKTAALLTIVMHQIGGKDTNAELDIEVHAVV